MRLPGPRTPPRPHPPLPQPLPLSGRRSLRRSDLRHLQCHMAPAQAAPLSLCVLILLCMCPHTTMYVSSYYYVCVLILLCMCPHTYVPHTTMYVSSYYVRHLQCHMGPAQAAPDRGRAETVRAHRQQVAHSHSQEDDRRLARTKVQILTRLLVQQYKD
jgi:hypothetical protein